MSGGGTNTVSSTSIPSAILPYYQGALSQGSTLAAGPGPQYYPGQQVAPLNPLQEQGLNQVQQIANSPTATQGANATNQFMSSGALMDPAMNPYLQGTFQQGAQQVQNNLDSQFAGSGRNIIGSAPVQSDEMNNLATQLYGGAYNTGVQATTASEALAPSLDAGMYIPSQQLMGAGAGLQGQTQNLINANMNQWSYNQQLPYNELSWYSDLLGTNASPFRSQSGSTQGNPNQATGAVGGAASGAALGSSFGPYGTAIGAVGGGLLGAFG